MYLVRIELVLNFLEFVLKVSILEFQFVDHVVGLLCIKGTVHW